MCHFLSVCPSELDQKDWTMIHILKSNRARGPYLNVVMCNIYEEQTNACRIWKSQGGLTANIKLHF